MRKGWWRPTTLLKRLARATARNFWLKLMSIAVALSFYSFIHSEENMRRTLEIGVVTLLPDAKQRRQLMTSVPDEVTVELVGPHDTIVALRSNDIDPIRIDLTDGKRTSVVIDKSMITLPPHVSVRQIKHAVFVLRWETIISPKMPVQVLRTGELSIDYELLGELVVEPSEVEVTGPQSVVEGMHFVRAQDFDFGKLELVEREQTLKLPLEMPPPLVTYDVNHVLVKVELVRRGETKEFFRQKIEVLGRQNARVLPSRVYVKVEGPPSKLKDLKAEDIKPRVEITKPEGEPPVAGTKWDVKVPIDGVQIVEIRPAQVAVEW